MRINKSIIGHKIYIFFHCHHGAAIIFLALLLSAAGIFVAINPFDIDFSQAIEHIISQVKDFAEKQEFINNNFILLKKGLGLWYGICVIAFIAGIVGTVIYAILRETEKILACVCLMFYSVWVIFSISLRQYTDEKAIIFMAVCMLTAMLLFVITAKLVDKDSAFSSIVICLITCVLVGFFCVAFAVVWSAVDRGDFNIAFTAKLLIGEVICVFAAFQMDILFSPDGSSYIPEVITDPIMDMIGHEYIEGVSGK